MECIGNHFKEKQRILAKKCPSQRIIPVRKQLGTELSAERGHRCPPASSLLLNRRTRWWCQVLFPLSPVQAPPLQLLSTREAQVKLRLSVLSFNDIFLPLLNMSLLFITRCLWSFCQYHYLSDSDWMIPLQGQHVLLVRHTKEKLLGIEVLI